MEKPYHKIGKRFRKLREKKELTLDTLRIALGMESTQSLSLVENGTALLQAQFQRKFCKIFGLDYKELNDELHRLRDARDIVMFRRRRKNKKLLKEEVLSDNIDSPEE